MNILAQSLLDFGPLISCIEKPVTLRRAAWSGHARAAEVALPALFSALSLPAPVFKEVEEGDLSLCELVINHRLAQLAGSLDGAGLQALVEGDGFLQHLPGFVRQYQDDVYYAGILRERVMSADGIALTTYRSVGNKAHTVVLVLPCAMSFAIARKWFTCLSEHYNVITWETRCAFGMPAHAQAPVALGLDAQSGDLLSVIGHHCDRPPHVMGICGGAVVALNAAQHHAAAFAGLSLWYGDYNFAQFSLLTAYQTNLRWLLVTAGADLDAAETVFDLCNDHAMLKTLNQEYAPSIMCPYAGVASLHRYAILNGSIMLADVAGMAARVPMHVAVISSEGDQTAHPEGSRKLAELLADCRLHMEREGDHLSFFDAGVRNQEIALECIAGSWQ